MNYAYSIFKNVQSFYSMINPASLSGAIDLIVVEQPDGSYLSTPFHVRFGKYGVLSSIEKYVDISINGKPIDLKMKLDENGVAFFVEETTEENIPEYLSTSPIPGSSPTEDIRSNLKGGLDFDFPRPEAGDPAYAISGLHHSLLEPLNIESESEKVFANKKDLAFKTSVFSLRKYRSLPCIPELLLAKVEDVVRGETHPDGNSEVHTVVRNRSLTPPLISRKLSYHKHTKSASKAQQNIKDYFDSDSDDIGSSLSSLCSIEATDSFQFNSGLFTPNDSMIDEALSDSEVDNHRSAHKPRESDVTEWRWGEMPKTREELKKIEEKRKAELAERKEAESSSWSDWFRWPRTKRAEDHGVYLEELFQNSKGDPIKLEKYIGVPSSTCSSPPLDSGNGTATGPSSPIVISDTENKLTVFSSSSPKDTLESPSSYEIKRTVSSSKVDSAKFSSDPISSANSYTDEDPCKHIGDRNFFQPDVFSMSDEEQETSLPKINRVKKVNYKRSLRLDSDSLKKLGLHVGANEARFAITTRFQGTSWCKCHIYLYMWSDKIIISDIDGTITKSDVLGHVIPAIGGQWAHTGVAELYTRLKENGYKMVYLSSRAIGQSHYTKKYLRSIAQDSKVLPDGPVLLSPTSILVAFRREVIDRKPQEFKIAVLSDLKECFPVKRPFYAGFGNRDTMLKDVKSYRAVGIPPEKILIINQQGLVKRADAIGFETSYLSIATDTVDMLFPPFSLRGTMKSLSDVDCSREHQIFQLKPQLFKPDAYSAFTFWSTKPNEYNQIENTELSSYEETRNTTSKRKKKQVK